MVPGPTVGCADLGELTAAPAPSTGLSRRSGRNAWTVAREHTGRRCKDRVCDGLVHRALPSTFQTRLVAKRHPCFDSHDRTISHRDEWYAMDDSRRGLP